MKWPNAEQLRMLRDQYPEGTRVELVEMDDPQAPPIGTQGTVQFIDGIGSVHIAWDGGSSLSALYGKDRIEKV